MLSNKSSVINSKELTVMPQPYLIPNNVYIYEVKFTDIGLDGSGGTGYL